MSYVYLGIDNSQPNNLRMRVSQAVWNLSR